MRILLDLKHWQLFLLIVGIPFVLALLDNIIVLGTVSEGGSIKIIINLLKLLPIYVYYLWILSVGSVLSERLPKEGNLHYNMSYFPWLILVSAIITTAFIFISVNEKVNQAVEQGAPSGSSLFDSSFWAFVIPVFIAIACLFAAINKMVKILVSAERKSTVRANDFFSEYVMAVVFPIGIWFLQPRINKLSNKA